MKHLLICAIAISISLTACLEDELAFDVVESPVLAVFERSESDPAMLVVMATFYELDKSGILDHSIGIDSVALQDMSVKIMIGDDLELAELTTDGDGKVIFSHDLAQLSGSSRLEWVGNHKNIPFRIYYNL